jgi:hypothetical protein
MFVTLSAPPALALYTQMNAEVAPPTMPSVVVPVAMTLPTSWTFVTFDLPLWAGQLLVTEVYVNEDTVFFLFDQVTVACLVARLFVVVPWAGGTPALDEFAPVPVQPEMVWVVELPARCVQLTVCGAAEAIPPGIAAAASDADPAMAAQTMSRTGR